jgi:adenosylcobinamide-GDP ribazoletransferase
VVLSALRGALGFLSRLPVGRERDHWDAFTETPVAFPLAGYVVGAVVALPLVLPVPAPTVAALFVVGVYVVTGVNHADGVTDLGDAAVVHGDPAERRAVMKDTAVGTGGVLALALALVALGAAALGLARLPTPRAVALVVIAEVGAKAAMALVVCLGTATHEGLGSSLTASAGPRSFLPVALVAAPAVLLVWPHVAAGSAAVLAALAVALGSIRWARANLGGVSGDVVGATNELARIAALHAGVVTWTLS